MSPHPGCRQPKAGLDDVTLKSRADTELLAFLRLCGKANPLARRTFAHQPGRFESRFPIGNYADYRDFGRRA
jgi:hypothetical protein